MELEDFDYPLPTELIAQRPLERRDSSRLLVLGQTIAHDLFQNLPEHLDKGDVLVLNDTRVVKARLLGRKRTGGKVELLLLSFRGREAGCLVKGRKLRDGLEIEVGEARCRLERRGRLFQAVFDRDVSELLSSQGRVPLPYYIREELPQPERYQTVYAREPGSVAAPTAGLHFTEELLERLRRKGVRIARITLHIGPATFLPLRSLQGPQTMLPEPFAIGVESAELINRGIEEGSLIAVGTSTVKALESAAAKGRVSARAGESTLFIAPGYRFKLPYKALITNLHLPRSTLLLLVCALFGKGRVLRAYEEAVERRYRFCSFGDAMLIKKVGRDVRG